MKHDSPGGLKGGRSAGFHIVLGVVIFVVCLASVPVRAQGTPPPVLRCTLDVPVIAADNANVTYHPMPFPVTVTVTNEGGTRSDSVFATIVLPPDLRLADNDAPDGYTKALTHPALFPQQSSTAQYMVRHPPTTSEKQYTIEVRVEAANADTALCEAEIIIPPLESPILAPRCYVPDALEFDDALDSYVPNPFTVRLTCVNNGNTPAYSVTGTIELPPSVVFDPPEQQSSRRIYPTPLEKWRIGDPVPELTWTVRWVPRLRDEAQPEFHFTVTGQDFQGNQLDSTEVRCALRVPGLQPLFNGWIDIPDSLPRRSDTCDVWPNPFPVRLRLKNISPQVGMIRRIVLYFPRSDGLSLNPASRYPTDFDPELTLDKGEEKTLEWLIDVENRITRRNVQISVIAYDDEGNPMAHDDRLPIACMRTEFRNTCLEPSSPVLRFDPVVGSYEPSNFVVGTWFYNRGCATLHDIVARLTWEDNSGLDLIEFDRDNTHDEYCAPGDLAAGDSVECWWEFRVRNKNSSDIPQYVEFTLDYGARETPWFTNACDAWVEIDPAGTTGIAAPSAPDACVLHPAHPNPFTGATSIPFELDRAIPVTVTVVDALGRECRRLLDGEMRGAGAHAVPFNAAGLHAGVYFIRFVTGEAVQQQRVILLK